jgi:hypothetical protein
MQTLPSGEWWTSLNADIASLNGPDFKNLPTAHAELVAILPSVSAPETLGSSVPTLGSLSRKLHAKKPTLPGPRHVSTGSFLDYGPNASFAPSFDQDSVEVGRFALGDVMWSRLRGRRLESASQAHMPQRHLSPAAAEEVQMIDGSPDEHRSPQCHDEMYQGGAKRIVLDPLLEPDQVAAIEDLMNTLDFEMAVQELLDRNERALTRLEELQTQRLGEENGGTSQVEVGSEEWDVGA